MPLRSRRAIASWSGNLRPPSSSRQASYMRIVHHALLIALALLIQTSWTHGIAIAGIRPDVVLIIVVYIGIRSGQLEATVFGFVSGFLLDVYNPEFMGVNALANSVVGFAVGYSRASIVAEDLRVQALALLIASLVHDILYFGLSSAANPAKMFTSLFRYGIGTAVYTAVIGMLCVFLVSIRFQGGIHLDVRRLHE
ncbi:TPA: rod shape-determining protein MreD [Candidatus Latescibacteria bacterium]|nr:rod shape-determining protein MreD [Candidatus Latescibacterota bacterium]